MARMLVLGAGPCGLASALLLARDGHEVTVLERDESAPPGSPEQSWARWDRDGVTQFRQPHFLLARFRELLESELPDVAHALHAAGALRGDPLRQLPPFITDRAPRPGDDRFQVLTARRPVLEGVLAGIAGGQERLELRRGTTVTGFITGTATSAGVPHICGVRTADGEELRADLVIDASGRRSQAPLWLREVGARPGVEEEEDSGFMYYGRHFRSPEGDIPEGFIGLAPLGSISLLSLPGDNGTWALGIVCSIGDAPLKRLRDFEVWRSVVAACPFHAAWLEGEPIDDMQVMSGLVDRYRRFVVDGVPVTTGFAAIADAWACTNPSLGRGISLGLLHALQLRDVVRKQIDDPLEFALAFDEVTETELTPWYRATLDVDRERLAEMHALREGREPPAPRDTAAHLRRALTTAMLYDADLFRAFMETVGCLATPEEVLSRHGVADRVRAVADGKEPFAAPGPSREELLALVG